MLTTLTIREKNKIRFNSRQAVRSNNPFMGKQSLTGGCSEGIGAVWFFFRGIFWLKMFLETRDLFSRNILDQEN